MARFQMGEIGVHHGIWLSAGFLGLTRRPVFELNRGDWTVRAGFPIPVPHSTRVPKRTALILPVSIRLQSSLECRAADRVWSFGTYALEF